MTNNLKEEIRNLKTKVEMGDGKVFEVNIVLSEEQVESIATLINQKEKELLEKFEEIIENLEDYSDMHEDTLEDAIKPKGAEYLRDRIKQLKEELNKEDR